VWDLVNTSTPYPQALPILLIHLQRPYDDGIREGIARALAVKGARPLAWDELVGLVQSQSLPDRVADGVMVAISAMARPADLHAIIGLIKDRSIGSRRVFLVRNLMRSKKPEARRTLLDMRDDPDLQEEIAARLKISGP
jgi:HEAT repeat protein